MLVASPPFKSKASIRRISARNAAGVRIATAMAAFVLVFLSSGSASAQTPSPAAILLRFKRYAAVTVAIPMTQKTGRPCVRISECGDSGGAGGDGRSPLDDEIIA